MSKQQTDRQTAGTKALVVAGLSGGTGKSIFSVGLTAALRDQGVVPFKKGPDYIDAGWMSKAAGRPCYNLDPFLMSSKAISTTFHQHIKGHRFALVEGNRGLFDGVNPEGEYSTAELAILLDLPVLLVLNCAKTTRTVAALALGCQNFEPRLHLAGVILNQIATSRHESIIRRTMEQYTDLPVLGIVPRLGKDIFPMRHLGVTPHQEYADADKAIESLAEMVRENCDLEAISSIMRHIPQREGPIIPKKPTSDDTSGEVLIGVLRDAAFQFYYEENLDALRKGGARLEMIDALSAASLPENLDGLYIGGGFPETSARQLAENKNFKISLRNHIEAGLPVYAECGGLIFLGRSLLVDNEEYALANIFPVRFTLAKKPQAHGYSRLIVEGKNAFYPEGLCIKGHEFRYSVVDEWEGSEKEMAFKMQRGIGFACGRDGLIYKNVLALYSHVLATGTPEWATGFLAAARAQQKRRAA